MSKRVRKDTIDRCRPKSPGRRKALKTLAGGVSVITAYHILPVRWSTPVVESIFLPAHAQTSAPSCDGCTPEDPCTISIISGDLSSAEVVVRVVGSVVPAVAGLPATITVSVGGAGTAPPAIDTVTDNQGSFAGTFTISGGPGITEIFATTEVVGADGRGRCSVRTGQQPTNPTTTPAPACATVEFRNRAGLRTISLSGLRCPDGSTFNEDISDAVGRDITLPLAAVDAQVQVSISDGRLLYARIRYNDGTRVEQVIDGSAVLTLTDVRRVNFLNNPL